MINMVTGVYQDVSHAKFEIKLEQCVNVINQGCSVISIAIPITLPRRY